MTDEVIANNFMSLIEPKRLTFPGSGVMKKVSSDGKEASTKREQPDLTIHCLEELLNRVTRLHNPLTE